MINRNSVKRTIMIFMEEAYFDYISPGTLKRSRTEKYEPVSPMYLINPIIFNLFTNLYFFCQKVNNTRLDLCIILKGGCARSSTAQSADRVMSHGRHVTRHSLYHCSSILYRMIDIKCAGCQMSNCFI